MSTEKKLWSLFGTWYCLLCFPSPRSQEHLSHMKGANEHLLFSLLIQFLFPKGQNICLLFLFGSATRNCAGLKYWSSALIDSNAPPVTEEWGLTAERQRNLAQEGLQVGAKDSVWFCLYHSPSQEFISIAGVPGGDSTTLGDRHKGFCLFCVWF